MYEMRNEDWAPAEGPTRVLVVEDEPILRTLTQATLTAAGFDVEAVPSAEEALFVLREEPFGLLVVDLMLGGMSGWDLIEELNDRGLRASTKVMILTALGSEGDIARGWELGVDEYLTKPFDPSELMASVRDVSRTPEEELRRRREEELRKAQTLHAVEAGFEEMRLARFGLSALAN